MTIGIDCRLWDETGVGRYIRNLVLNLLRQDKKNSYVLFVSTDGEEAVKEQISSYKAKIVPIDVPWHSLKEQVDFPRILKKEKLDLMHFTYFSLPITYSGRYILTIHDLIIHHFSTGKASTKPFPVYYGKRFFYKQIINRSAKKAVEIIAVSKATKSEIMDHLNVPDSKIEVVYEAADPLPPDSELKLDFPYILYVGNLYPHKNMEKTLEAFKNANKPKGARLLIVGKEDFFRKRIEDLVGQLGIQNEVVFAGKVSDGELGAYYKNAIATIVPSLMEGFGLPALEAMKNNCLVICSDIPSLREVCGTSAIYFDPEDKYQIRDAIEKAFSVDARKMTKQAKKRADSFSWSKMATQTLKIYESSFSLRQN